MIRSAKTTSKEKLGRKGEQQQQDGADEQLHIFVWDQEDFNS
jgi:hypothetical protein